MSNNNEPQNDDILTLLEIADYLKVSRKTILRMLKKGSLKGFKVGGQWRFMKPVVKEWIAGKMQNLSKKNLARVIRTAKKVMPLSHLITEKSIILDLQPGTKKYILEQIAQRLYETGLIQNKEDFLKKLILREEMISTAVSNGIAFPHLRNPQENQNSQPFIALAVCPEGTDFDSIDGGLTYVFVVICAKSELTHLRLLAKVSWLFKQNNVLDKILKSRTKDDIISVIRETDIELIINL